MTDLQKKILELSAAGLKVKDISSQLGCCRQSVTDTQRNFNFTYDSALGTSDKNFSAEYVEWFTREWNAITLKIRRCFK